MLCLVERGAIVFWCTDIEFLRGLSQETILYAYAKGD